MTSRATCAAPPLFALTRQYDLSAVKESKGDKYNVSPESSSTRVAMAEAGASEKETKGLDQRGGIVGGASHGPMGAGPQHPSGDETDAGHLAWERERNLMRCVHSLRNPLTSSSATSPHPPRRRRDRRFAIASKLST